MIDHIQLPISLPLSV